MRFLVSAIGVVLLLAFLTWTLKRGIDTNAPAYATMLHSFDDFALAEASLHRDVLQARAGLLRNYDTLGDAVRAMESAVARLRSHAEKEGLDSGPVDRLAKTVAEQEELTERFKSSNALLRNSMSYVGLFSTDPAFDTRDAKLASTTLAAAVLHTRSNTSPESIQALQKQLDLFAAQTPSVGPGAEAAQALLAHASLLQSVMPKVDGILKALMAVPSRQPLEEIRALFADHQEAVEATAQRYRLLLYLASLLLLVALVRLGLRLRAGALALRRQAALEHVIAKNSTRLINCPPAETEVRLRQALGELGAAIGAQRAYVALAENPTRVHAWSAEGATYPLGWPERALELSAQFGATRSDIVSVPDVAGLPPGEVRDALAAAGVRGWTCAPLIRPGGARGVIGFDSFRPARNGIFALPVARLAGDAVARAIERQSFEQERTRLTARLERARRMQMIGTLAAGITHNFNNIIGAILGYAEMIEPQLAPGTKPVQHIDEIRRAAERARDLIDNILAFGRRRDASIGPVQVRALVDEAVSMLRASLRPGVELIVEDVPAEITILGDPVQLQQIILNLCANAAQAIQGNGAVRVTAAEEEVARPMLLSHGELEPGRYARLAVSDTGCGFGEVTALRLFEPFFTTRSAGTGLGLATVREIVHDHNGALNVRSVRGRGSRFEAWLPALSGGGEATAGPRGPSLGHGETVLIVEGERECLLRHEEMLAALGYEPVGFERPASAIDALRSEPDRFDAVLVTQAAAGSGSLNLARALHEIKPRQPVLFAATSASEVSADALAEAGIAEVLRQPLVGSEVAAALARFLRSPARYERNAIPRA